MWKLLDRQMFLSYLKSYFVCMVSLLGLFIVVDLFTNLEDFMKAHDDFASRVKYIAVYYAYNTAKNFDQISEAIVLLAAMFTVALMQRNNELLPLLSAGVSTRRAVMPALVGAMCMLGLSVANQELVLPHVDGFMVENRGDPTGERATEVAGAHDSQGFLITGRQGIKKGLIIREFACVFTPRQGQTPIMLQSKEAHYIPKGSENHSGGWLLTATTPEEVQGDPFPNVLCWIAPGKYFLRTVETDFDRTTRMRNWQIYTPTWKLRYELSLESTKLASVAVLFHMRLTRPLLGLVLVLLGLSVILRDQNSNIFISAGLCLCLCALFFASCFTCQSLGNYEFIVPVLAAWLPVLVFGPLALVMFDAIHT